MGTRTFPDLLEIVPHPYPVDTVIQVPGSKSITNRALILAALSDPRDGSDLRGVLQSEDTEIMVEALRGLGFRVRADWPNLVIHVRRGPTARVIPCHQADLFVGNSGTTMRFLTALVGLGHGHYRLDGVARMRERPMGDLLAAMGQLGIQATSERGNGHPPILVQANGWRGANIRIRGDVSSQFLSGLLMAAPLGHGSTHIQVEGPLVSRSYVDMTMAMMEQFGVPVVIQGSDQFEVAPNQWYRSQTYTIEPDASAAGYFWAAAAILGGKVAVSGLSQQSLQGDVRLIKIFEGMGCATSSEATALVVEGPVQQGVTVDMNDLSDGVMTVAAVACFAKNPTTIHNVAHLRYKESDRLTALVTELRRLGAKVQQHDDGLTIVPTPLHGAVVETYNDHRLAMSLALIGLRVPGIRLRNPGCVAKTYPSFFQDLNRLCT
jgi:3-phosphoshikimate 1-carboxyvinyltransferase